MNALLLPSYFPPVSHFVVMAKADNITLEADDNFQKQTLRNRMYIYSPNGAQLLNLPVKHSKFGHQKTRDVKLETAFDWQKQHFKSLEAAYRSSPYFEYFEDAFAPIFEKKHTFLLDLNLEALDIVCCCIGMPGDFGKTEEYFHDAPGFHDYRRLANGKKDTSSFEAYPQVFGDRHGFINNLSILDLLFNQGRRTLDYLKRQDVQSI